jgi:hypothetical protein
MEPEQASLFEKQQQTPEPTVLPDSFVNEYNAYALLEGRLQELLVAWRLPADCIYTATNKDTFVVKFNDRVLWRMRFKPKVHYISIREQFIPLLPDGTEHSKPSQGFVRLPAEGPEDIQRYTDLLLQITEKTILSVKADFDCCARYEACSDAGHCVGLSPATCGYNRVLRSGKIYYGKNRNIDEMGNIRKSE